MARRASASGTSVNSGGSGRKTSSVRRMSRVVCKSTGVKNKKTEEWMEKPDANEGEDVPQGMEYFQGMRFVRLFNDGMFYETKISREQKKIEKEVKRLEKRASVASNNGNEQRQASIQEQISMQKRRASVVVPYVPDVGANGIRQGEQGQHDTPNRKRMNGLTAAVKGPFKAIKSDKPTANKYGQFCITQANNNCIIGKVLGSFDEEGSRAFLLDGKSEVIMTITNTEIEDGKGVELLVKNKAGDIMSRVRQRGFLFNWRVEILTAEQEPAYVLKPKYVQAAVCPNMDPKQSMSLRDLKNDVTYDDQCIKTHDSYTNSDYFAIDFGKMDLKLKSGLLTACILIDAGLWKPENIFETDHDVNVETIMMLTSMS